MVKNKIIRTKRNNVYFVIIVFILSINAVTISYSSLPITEDSANGWIQEIDGITILYLNGTYYEMGFQHGSLLKEQVNENYRAILHFSEQKGISYEKLNDMWNTMKEYVPQDYIDEMNGLADASGLSFEVINTINMAPTFLGRKLFQCSGFSAWGNATETGELIHAKSYDYPLFIKDPVSGKHIQENQIIMIRKPSDGYASLNPSIIGLYGSGGINEKGIGLASLYSWSFDNSIEGTPRRFKMPLIMDRAANAEEAIELLFSNKTIGFNTILSDANEPAGYALEETKNHSYIGTWNHPSESIDPFWSIKQVVRRSNTFLHPETAATQRPLYNPSSLLLMFLGQNDYYPMYIHYKALSDEIENRWELLLLKTQWKF